MNALRKRVVVIKLGGSVLVDDNSYQDAAGFLARRLQPRNEERLVVVVSARKGITDELERIARDTTLYPNARTLDLLWSTGEIRSAALLALHLEELSISTVALNVHETGLQLNGTEEVAFLGAEIENALAEHSVVVVPGFFGTHLGGAIRSLGRGGSDLSAVVLAEGLGASRCELIKDVPGYFTEDPNLNPTAEFLSWISYETAIEMAERGCELVQRVALDAARERGLQLVVRTLDDAVPGTVVSTHTNQTYE
jgi:aspartate kinase